MKLVLMAEPLRETVQGQAFDSGGYVLPKNEASSS